MTGNAEEKILRELISGWVSVGSEYVRGVEEIDALYFYASSESGVTYANLYVEQAGVVKFPGDLDGLAADTSRVRALHDAVYSDLRAAEAAFAAVDVPAPTEYRVSYVPETGALDVELSRASKFPPEGEKDPMEDGIIEWLGDRAPRLPF